MDETDYSDNDLNAPLRPNDARRWWGAGVVDSFGRVSLVVPTMGVLVLLGLVLVIISFLRFDTPGGEPVVTLSLNVEENVSPVSEAAPVFPDVVDGDIILSGEAGVAVVKHLDGPLSSPEISMVDARDAETGQNPLSSLPGFDPRIVEQSVMGSLPRIGQGGERPDEIYAHRRSLPEVRGVDDPAFIAVVVGGLGINTMTTDAAMKRLPNVVSLAFAPYGDDLQNRVNRARMRGHEVLLQLPMEPFDYPNNDPGPHTLLTGVHVADNLERLHWLMARFTGYFAVINYMGAKFTSSSEDLAPVLQEIGARGLSFVDDGSFPRSQIVQVGLSTGLRVSRSDMVIDAGQTQSSVEDALRQLEFIAVQRGYAIGSATAFPATLEALSGWSQDLSARGIKLVPVSVIMRLKSHQPLDPVSPLD